ncbi:uncharacterized protein [Mytilus edulis]|uniref:uncharacterized protein n=1 Tax=Mytilus edulis TaxID=6550 RepID=UPI0039EFBFDA
MSCPHPPAISGGTSEVVNDVATYTCNTGYKINGSPQIGCYNGQWSSPLPECSLINSANQYWLDITNNQDEIPVWLIALVGLAAVLAVILLLACLAAVLWKLFGSTKVDPNLMIDHTGGGAGKGCSCCYRYAGCCRRKRPRNEQKVASNGVKPMSDKMNMVQETPTKNQAISQVFEVKENNNSNLKQHVSRDTNQRLGNCTRIFPSSEKM